MFAELEKLLKIFMSSFLKSLIVNKKYTVPEKAVMIKKNENNSGGLSPGETFSMFNFSDNPGLKEEISIYRLNRTKGIICIRSFQEFCLLSKTRVRT
jgi:hypothetical protein